MPVCPATVMRTGVPCTREGLGEHSGFCKMHKNQHPPRAAEMAEAAAVRRAVFRSPAVVTARERHIDAYRAMEHAQAQFGVESERALEEGRAIAPEIHRAVHEANAEQQRRWAAFRAAEREATTTITAQRALAAAPVVPAVEAAVAAVATVATVAAVATVEATVADPRRPLSIARRTARNADILARCPHLSADEYTKSATNLILLWQNAPIPGYTPVIAYRAIRYLPMNDPALPAILRASLQLLFLTKRYHPNRTEYTDIPQADRTAALAALAIAVVALGPMDITPFFLPASDPMRATLRERLEQDQRALAAAAAEGAAAAAAAAAAAFIVRMREEPVVFRRDPEGSVDLRAFAVDGENVHRSSVQSATERSVKLLMGRDVPPTQNTLDELTVAFHDPTMVKWVNATARNLVLHEIATDSLDTVAFSVRYGDVLDRVWAFVKIHREKKDLVIRLAQEADEGVGKCSNGKMARLVNVLQGYDDSLFVDPQPPKEAFQELMARLSRRPAAERGPAATALFEEYRIADAERGAWLEALEDYRLESN